MAAQATIAAKTAVTAIAITGTALSIDPRGKDANGVLQWIAPGATALDDLVVDASYRVPTSKQRKIKSMVRVFSPKTAINSTTGLTEKVGENIFALNAELVDNATAAEKQKVLDVFTSVVTSPEFRDMFINGNLMY